MVDLNILAEKLNKTIRQENEAIFSLLSVRGKAVYFPHKGILGQTKEAKGKAFNATIGQAYEEDDSIMCLECIDKHLKLERSDVFSYASSFGLDELRSLWQQGIIDKNKLSGVAISKPVVTNAVTHALSVAGYLLADDNTEIIMPEPFWGNYKLIFEVTYGASIKTFPLYQNEKFNTAGFQKVLNDSDKKKIVVFNFPNNPTGYTPSEAEIDEITGVLLEYAKNKPLAVIADDAYFGLVYEQGVYRKSIFSELAGLHKNLLAVKTDGVTKEIYAWGLRVGFITFACAEADPELYLALEDKAAGACRGTISNASHLSQSLIIKALNDNNYQAEKAAKMDLLKKRYGEVKRVLNENPEWKEFFKPLPFNSGYFMCLELAEGLDAEKVRQHLLEEYDTGVITIGRLIRVAFSSLSSKKIASIFNNIFEACKKLK